MPSMHLVELFEYPQWLPKTRIPRPLEVGRASSHPRNESELSNDVQLSTRKSPGKTIQQLAIDQREVDRLSALQNLYPAMIIIQ